MSWETDRRHPREGLLDELWDCQILGISGQIPFSFISTDQGSAAGVGSHMASLEWFVLRGHNKTQLLQWQLKSYWSTALDDPVDSVLLAQPVHQFVAFKRRDGHLESLHDAPSLSPSLHRCVSHWLGGTTM